MGYCSIKWALLITPLFLLHVNFQLLTSVVVIAFFSIKFKITECTPVQFWSLVRQGTTLPNPFEIERMQGLTNIHNEVIRNYMDRRSFPERGRLCPEDFDLFKRYR